MTKKTVKEWRADIKKEVPYINIKPFSHNIVGICLGAIAKEYGKEQADKAIDDFQLEQLGWRKQS